MALDTAWTPTSAMVHQLDRQLGWRLGAALDSVEAPGTSVRDYYRQYFGVFRGGKPVILVNGFHAFILEALPELRWRDESVSPCDVGVASFRTWYDPATGEFETIHFTSRYGGPVPRRQ
jgi:hypothetical protein